MRAISRIPLPWRSALAAAGFTGLALVLAVALAVGLELRSDVSPVGERLAADATAAAAAIPAADPLATRDALVGTGVAARLLDAEGTVIAQLGGGPGLWARGEAGWAERAATTGAAGWTLLNGTVEARATTATGRTVVLRRGLGAGAGQGQVSAPGKPLLVAGALLVGLAGAAAAWRATRLRRRIDRLAARAEAVGAGRQPAAPERPESPEWARLDAGLRAAGRRVADLRAGVEGRFDALGAGLAPLALPAAARTPTGARIRNEALERLVSGLPLPDADAVETAVREGLAGGGATSRRVALGDGRTMEVEAWPVPGGRLVAISERTEQDRLAAVRRQVTGAAVRHLQAPVSEIQALASDLLAEGPAGAAPSVRRIQATADRMEGIVASLLRGTLHDPNGRPLRREPVGASGLVWGLARAWDERLRAMGLRLDTRVAPDVPVMRTDPRLVEEILTELIANAAKFSPRGGTITVAADGRGDGGVALRVSDSGEGIAGEEVAHVTEPFVRGRSAAALPGAGLGLGVASALAARLGGRLVVTPGPGGQAALELPPPPATTAPADVAPADADSDGPPAPPAPAPERALALNGAPPG